MILLFCCVARGVKLERAAPSAADPEKKIVHAFQTMDLGRGTFEDFVRCFPRIEIDRGGDSELREGEMPH